MLPMPELSTSLPSRLEPQESDEKISEIRLACEFSDLDSIRKLALSPGGLVNDSLRRTTCMCCWSYLVELRTDYPIGPLLLGCNGDVDASTEVKELPSHRDEDQVELDVHRSFVYYPEGIQQFQSDIFYCSFLLIPHR